MVQIQFGFKDSDFLHVSFFNRIFRLHSYSMDGFLFLDKPMTISRVLKKEFQGIAMRIREVNWWNANAKDTDNPETWDNCEKLPEGVFVWIVERVDKN